MHPTAILPYLTPFKNKRDILVHEQNVGDIITGILLTHDRYTKEYDKIVGFFIGKNGIETAKNVWAFVKRNVPYKVEPEQQQLLKSPAAIITPAAGGIGKRNTSDCKNMSLFIGGILAAAERKGQKINWCYRFSSYKFLDKVPQHVFCVINPDTNNETWVDAVLPTFNNHKQYYYKTDKKVKTMSLISLAGMGAPKKKKKAAAAAPATKEQKKKKRQDFFKGLKEKAKKTGKLIVKYNPATVVSRNAFITLTALNARSLATNLKKVIAKDPTQLFNIWSKVGGNKEALIKAIETGARKKRLGAVPMRAMTVNRGIVNPRAYATATMYAPAVPVRYAANLVPDSTNIYDDTTAPELEPETDVDIDSIGLVDPATQSAAAIAAAAPILALIIPLFKKLGISDKDVTDVVKDVEDAGKADAQNIADAIEKEANGIETPIGNNIIKGGTPAPAAGGGAAGGKLPIIPIAIGAAALLFFMTKKK
jgi:hypothetical protein